MKYPEIEVQLTGEDGNAFANHGSGGRWFEKSRGCP